MPSQEANEFKIELEFATVNKPSVLRVRKVLFFTVHTVCNYTVTYKIQNGLQAMYNFFLIFILISITK